MSEMAMKRLSGSSVVALNRHLDEAERLITQDIIAANRNRGKVTGLGIMENTPNSPSSMWNEMTPPQSGKPDAPQSASSVDVMVDISKSAETLLDRVTRAASQLRQRQEDFKVSQMSPIFSPCQVADFLNQHLHCVAVAKAEEASQKIVELEAEIDQL